MKASALALLIGALAVFGNYAQAAEPDQEVTITGTRTKTISYDPATRAPIQIVSVSARVTTRLDVLTLNSGVAILKDNVLEAARKACEMADPFNEDDGDCVHEAVKGAQPQVDALIARARATQG